MTPLRRTRTSGRLRARADGPAGGAGRPRLLWLPLLAFALPACDAEESAAAGQAATAERSVAVAAVEVAPLDLSQEIQVSGNIEPIREIRLAARMTGIVEEVRFEEGQRVERGDVLARFDVSEQEAELARARATLERARSVYDRSRALLEREMVTEAEYEDARTERAVAESEVRLWETRAAFGTVTAPAEAVVTRKLVEAGDAVSSGEPLFVLADLSTMVIPVNVSDVHAARISEGQAVEVQVDAEPGRVWEASIRRIFPVADPESRLVTVEVALDDPNREILRPGYLARVRIDVDRREGVLAVPNQALLASTGRAPFVFIIEDERLVRRNVVTGVSRRDWTEILEGLEPGERVVGSNPANLQEGTLVRVSGEITHPSDRER